ncbi:DUF1109 domain-containing protein [Roseiarcaceae bacterium H3SJ34-1]|uniref:NrsF family protein n=1 Tax=Terripilifer ovatus TaxID=3032367 RepID=UPI003AB932E6|nr:DUF1109 domain-containing protein [Roseiarcaceae bacterium H3SJ34-1]
MNTDELIDVLSTNVERVDTGKVSRTLQIVIISGLILALITGIAALGVRTDVRDPSAFGFLVLKVGFGVAVVLLGSRYLLKHVRPGGETRSWIFLTTVPFVAVMALAGVSLISAPASHWNHMMMGDRWLECLLSIPVIAVVPFAVITWTVRMAAPTNLTRTGALAGLVAGGISAVAYALHCTDDSLPFVALWYGSTIVLCTLAGALTGPRLLRW